jgi:hypothetical protein
MEGGKKEKEEGTREGVCFCHSENKNTLKQSKILDDLQKHIRRNFFEYYDEGEFPTVKEKVLTHMERTAYKSSVHLLLMYSYERI